MQKCLNTAPSYLVHFNFAVIHLCLVQAVKPARAISSQALMRQLFKPLCRFREPGAWPGRSPHLLKRAVSWIIG